MSLLEERYRYWLRLLPASYRAEREEEMVSVFLEGSPDVSDEDNPRPRWSELASVAALAVRVRLGGVGAAPRFFSWGETVRLTALLGLLLKATFGVLTVAAALLTYGAFGVTDPALAEVLGASGSPERLVSILESLAGALWILPFVALVLGHVRTAKVLALLAFASDLYPLVEAVRWDEPYVESVLVGLLIPMVILLALGAGFHRDARPARRPLWLLALPLGVGAGLAALFGAGARFNDPDAWMANAWIWPWLDMPGLASVLILGAGITYMGVHAWAPARRTASWPLALVILSVPVLCVRLTDLNFEFADEVSETLMVGMLGQAVVLLLVVLALAVLGIRTLPAAAPAREPRGSEV